MPAFDANGSFFTQQMMNRGGSGGGGGSVLGFPLLADAQVNVFDIKANSIAAKIMDLQAPMLSLNPSKSGGLLDRIIDALQLKSLFGSFNPFQGNEGLAGASQDQHDYRGATPIETPEIRGASMEIG